MALEIGLRKIEKNIIEIGEIADQLNSEYYIIIMPWPDTLNFGQTEFNWEKYTKIYVKNQSAKVI